MKLIIMVLMSALISGCVGLHGAPVASTEFLQSVEEKRQTLPPNPQDGKELWGGLKVGMTVEDVLKTLPNSKFDDQWSSGGVVGVMGEAGIYATNKVKVVAEITGPFNSPSNLYLLFDEAGRLDGLVIFTIKKNLPEEVLRNYGSLGFNVAEYKEAAKLIIGKYAIQDLGKRVGSPSFGKEKMDSFGTVGVAAPIGGNMALGVGIPTGSISPATIVQRYDRDGFKSMISIHSAYLGLYNVYANVSVFMTIQTKSKYDEEIGDF